MYEEIKDILLGKLPSKWTQEEIKEAWQIVFNTRAFNKREVSKLCAVIKNNANLLKYPDPTDKCPVMWVSIFLFVSYKKLPLYINHPQKPVKDICTWRLGVGK